MKNRYFMNFLMSMLFLSTSAFANPTIKHISPSTGPAAGGTSVDITGSGFTGATSFNFGTAPAASFTVNSDTSITAVTPAHTPQVISADVTTPDGTSANTKKTFYTFQGSWQAYVTNSGGGSGGGTTLSVFDTANPDAGSASIAVGNEPNALFISPDGSKAYVANYDNGSGTTISVVDTATNSVIGSPLAVGDGPNSIAITPDGTQVYVANSSANTVSVFNTIDNSINTIVVGNGPDALAITPDGSKVLSANFYDDTVSIIDTATNLVIGSPVPAGSGPLDIAITPDSAQAYIANFDGTAISIINTTDNTVTTVPVVLGPVAAAITPNGHKAYVVNYGHQLDIESVVSVFHTAHPDTGSTSVTVGQGPSLIAITPDGSKAYVVNYNDGDPNSGTVSVIDTATDSVVGDPIGVGIGPNAIAITPDGAQVYVANFGGDVVAGTTVSVIDTATNGVTNVTVGDAPTMIAIMPDQAPLARFKALIAEAGQTSSFDASASATPTGTITLYSWKFGDGHELESALPTVSHTYAVAGNYTVHLTVTNSAGTSTSQVFSYYAYNNNNFGSYNVPLCNNGGPTAETKKKISVPVASPLDFQGYQIAKRNINVLTWKAPLGGGIVSYRIYRDAHLTDLVAEIAAADILLFKDGNRIKNKKYNYYIVAVGEEGISQPASTTVSPAAPGTRQRRR